MVSHSDVGLELCKLTEGPQLDPQHHNLLMLRGPLTNAFNHVVLCMEVRTAFKSCCTVYQGTVVYNTMVHSTSVCSKSVYSTPVYSSTVHQSRVQWSTVYQSTVNWSTYSAPVYSTYNQSRVQWSTVNHLHSLYVYHSCHLVQGQCCLNNIHTERSPN